MNPLTVIQGPALSFDERMAVLESAIDKYHVYLEHYLTGLTRNHADAEDLLSSLWVHVLHKFKDDQIQNLALLRRKAYQLFIDHYRARSRAGQRLQFEDTPPDHGIIHAGKEAYSDTEEIALKEKFWSEFPAEISTQEQEILWLSARYGFTIQEISKILSLPTSTVGDRLQQARQRFIEYFNTL